MQDKKGQCGGLGGGQGKGQGRGQSKGQGGGMGQCQGRTQSSGKDKTMNQTDKVATCGGFKAKKIVDMASFTLEDMSEALEKRGFKTSIVKNISEASDLVINKIIPETKSGSVAFGGSRTVEDSGLVAKLKEVDGLEVLDTYDRSDGVEKLMERRRQALLIDCFICSANALGADGRVYLLDLYGNRTAAVQFGPKKVILLVGKNKIASDTHAAIHRVRNVASPLNAKRLEKKTPCAKTGECADCASPDRICGVWTIVDWCHPKGRIHVVLIDDDHGF